MKPGLESRSRARVLPVGRPTVNTASPALSPPAWSPSSLSAQRQLLRVVCARATAMAGVFAASATLEAASPPPVLFLTWAVFCCASVPAVLRIISPARRSWTEWRSLPLSAPAAVASLVRVFLLLSGLAIVGPTRVFIASGAVVPIFLDFAFFLTRGPALDRRRTLRSTLVVFLSLWLVAYDATGGRAPAEKATLVSRRVLKTRAGHAVELKFHSLAKRLGPRLAKPRLLYSRFANISPPGRDPNGPLQPPPAFAPNGALLRIERRGENQSAPPVPAGPPFRADPVGAPGRTLAVEKAKKTESRLASSDAQSAGVKEHLGGASHYARPRMNSATANSASSALSNGDSAHSAAGPVRRKLLAIVQEGEAENPVVPHDSGGNKLSAQGADLRGEKIDAQAIGYVGAGERPRDTQIEEAGVETPVVTLARGFIGISLAVFSFLTSFWEAGQTDLLAGDLGSRSVAHAFCMICASLLSTPLALISLIWEGGQTNGASATSAISLQVPIFALCFISLPHFLHADDVSSFGTPAVNMATGKAPARSVAVGAPNLHGGDVSSAGRLLSTNAFAQFMAVLSLFPFVRAGTVATGATVAPFSFSLWLPTIGLALVLRLNWLAVDRDWSRSMARSGMSVVGRGGPLLSLGWASRGSLSSIPRLQRNLGAALSKVAAFVVQSRADKASWQVFNFLVMQTGMVIVETTYAFMTDSVGLISISADNLFCCIALGAGLFAIRKTGSAKSSSAFSFGLARLESLCGFVNSLLLIVVAILLMLEAVDRVLNPEFIDNAHIFAVCLFGIIGNGLGLVFFPPESRRENHNVQSIYLHIWANTLAYVGISASAFILGLNPDWSLTELFVALVVAALVVGSAIPLMVRSSRLLMNYPAAEKMADVRATRAALSYIDGVSQVADFRVWNLTPTSMVVTAHLLVSPAAPVHERNVLRQARSLCANLGAPTQQTTIQITRGDVAIARHVRSSSLGSYDIEGVLGRLPHASTRLTLNGTDS